jgi:hypothetical protein
MSITFAADGTDGINMHNRNAAELLDLLGLTDDPDGEVPAQDLLGRVLLAQTLLDVATDDEHGLPDVQDGRWFEGGRQPGYLAGRLAELHQLATWAAQHGADVWWG